MVTRRLRQRGMTMVEVMMAMIVATIGLFGSLAMMSLLFRNSTFTRNMSEAMSLVQSKLELEVSRPVTTTSPAAATTTETVMDALGNITGSGPFLYTRATQWSTDGTRRWVRVTVSFSDNAGNPHQVYAERERNTP